MELVKITRLDLVSENDMAQTWEFTTRSPSKGRILAFRKKGTVSGNHWHKGSCPAKDPEELLMVSGKIKLSLKPFQEKEIQEEHLLEAPILIHIPKNVYHRVEALTDISFLESNSIEEHASDTYYPD